ncbi:MAG: hypothetical protein JWO38_5068 [Gemmataceae bacterium]|nr:hypothetical protein [Gemmataceae bacterium]
MATKPHDRSAPGRPVAAPPRLAGPPGPGTPPANLPIPPRPAAGDEEVIRVRAYQLWIAAGRPEGDGTNFWLDAEAELGRR